MFPETIKRTRYSSFSVRAARMLAWCVGWTLEDDRTGPVPRGIYLGAPHTTNWDLFWALVTAFGLRIPMVFMMKDSVFVGPMGAVFRWLGGIPVNRRAKTNAVDQMVALFKEGHIHNLVIAPEGTRKGAPYWKLGFYWIAVGAGVPVVPGYINYTTRRVGIGLPIEMSGDLAADFAKLQAFYASKQSPLPQFDPKVLESNGAPSALTGRTDGDGSEGEAVTPALPGEAPIRS